MKQHLLDTFVREHGTTMKVIREFPPDQAEFRPHPRSKSARELIGTFVQEQGIITRALTNQMNQTGQMPKLPDDLDEIVAQFEREFEPTRKLIEETPEDDLVNGTVPFFLGPGKRGNVPKVQLVEMMVFDQIHHRGQLSVYSRMAGGTVPAIYGPSADEKWF